MPLAAMPPPAPLSFQMVPPRVSVSSVVVTVLVFVVGEADRVGGRDRAGVDRIDDELVGLRVDRRLPLDGDGLAGRQHADVDRRAEELLARDRARDRAVGLARARQPPLAGEQPAVHQVVAVARDVGVLEAERVAHLVHDGGEQVVVPGRRAGRVGLQPRGGEHGAELGVVERRGVEVPAVAGGVGVERDLRRRERAEIEARHVGDAEGHRLQRVELRLRQAGRAPARDRGVDEEVELGLAEHAVVDDDGMAGASGLATAETVPVGPSIAGGVELLFGNAAVSSVPATGGVESE